MFIFYQSLCVILANRNDHNEMLEKKSLVTNTAHDTLDFKRDVLSQRINHYVGKYFIISLKNNLELIGGEIIDIKYDEIFNQNILHIRRATDQSIRAIPVTSISNFENHFNSDDDVISKLEILYTEQLARKGSYHFTELGVFFVSSVIVNDLDLRVMPIQRPPKTFLDTPLTELTRRSINNDLVEYRKYSNFFSYVLLNEIFRLMIDLKADEYLKTEEWKYIDYVLTDVIDDISTARMDYKKF
jgi:hypothetical protein